MTRFLAALGDCFLATHRVERAQAGGAHENREPTAESTSTLIAALRLSIYEK